MTLQTTSVNVESWQLEASKILKLNMSHILRIALDAAINSNDDVEKEEAEINKQKTILAIREKVLAIKKQRKSKSDTESQEDLQRLHYLQDHPEIMQEFGKGSISNIGYDLLQRELKISSKQLVQEYLIKQNGGEGLKKI